MRGFGLRALIFDLWSFERRLFVPSPKTQDQSPFVCRAGIPVCRSSLTPLDCRKRRAHGGSASSPTRFFPLLFNHTVFNRQECLPY